MSYKPPYNINSQMLRNVADIMKLIGYISGSQAIDINKPKLRRTNQINSIYSSLAIENNQLTKDQVKDIINGKLVIGPKRDILEVQNALKCYDDIININPYQIDDLLRYHKIMMQGLLEDAGNFRLTQEGVFDGDTVIFIAPPANLVPELIENLYDYLINYDDNFLIKSCFFHYEFEFIHPFSDGNGRLGRLFQTCLLANNEEVFSYLPIESIIKERQQEYYDAISKSNQEGNADIFIEFMLEAILETLKRVNLSSKVDSSAKSLYVEKLMSVMDEHKAYKLKDLMELLNLTSLSSFKKHYIIPAMDDGLIAMTIPNVPTSRSQRYIKITYIWHSNW